MTAEELANRIAELRASLDGKIEQAKKNDAEVRAHVKRLNEMGIDIEPGWRSCGNHSVDFYGAVWWEFRDEAHKMLLEFFKLPEQGSTEIELRPKKPEPVEPGLRPGYDVPRDHK